MTMDETTNETTCDAICQPVPGSIERCMLEPRHRGMHVSDTVTWDNHRVMQRTPDTCVELACVRKIGHKGEHTSGPRTAQALDAGDDFGRCEARHPDDSRVRCTTPSRTVHAQHANGSEVWEDFRPEPLTEERINDAMAVLERRIREEMSKAQGRLKQMSRRVEQLEQRMIQLAVPMADPYESGPLSDLLTRLDQVESSINRARDRITQHVSSNTSAVMGQVESAVNGARDAITQHVSSNTSAVMDRVNKQAVDPGPVTYPFERDGVVVLGPEVWTDGIRVFVNGVAHVRYVSPGPAPTLESWVCNHDGRCRLPVDHAGSHRAAEELHHVVPVPLGQSPTAAQDVVHRPETCGDAGLGESWCSQPAGHGGYCDPNPDQATDAGGHVYDERPSNHNGQ